jgi:putative heme-binding domain-containing protein
MRTICRIAAVLAGSCLAFGQGTEDTGARPQTKPGDVAAGERMYRTQCAYCHGPRGEGGRGAMLARRNLIHAAIDQAMFDVIRHGIPDSEMPGHWFTPRETWQIVAFVRTLGRVAPQKVAGDSQRGKTLYAAKGCSNCHTIAGRGGPLGPDLTDIGTRRSPGYLRQALLEPEAAVPEGFVEIQLVTRDGRRITGVRLNEDAFSIQLRDLAGNLQSFFKSELAECTPQAGKSPMPSYKETLAPGEVDDLVAWLDSLRGNP